MPYLIDVVSIVSEPLVDCGDTSLASRVVITNKVRAMLVDSVVSQMHTLLALQVREQLDMIAHMYPAGPTTTIGQQHVRFNVE